MDSALLGDLRVIGLQESAGGYSLGPDSHLDRALTPSLKIGKRPPRSIECSIMAGFPEAWYVQFVSAIKTANLGKVSVVILTCNRQDFVRRQLLNLCEFEVSVIVADGSERAWGNGQRGSLGLATWEYFHLPGLSTYSQRLVEAVNRVTTEFVTFADDQDGHLGTGIQKAVETLTTDATAIAAGGTVASCLDPDSPTTIVRWGYLSDPLDLSTLTDIERLERVWTSDRTANLCYQVYRTQDMRDLLLSLPDSSWKRLENDWVFFETIYAVFFCLNGNFKVQDFPYWVRAGASLETPELNSPASTVEITDLVNSIMNMPRMLLKLRSLSEKQSDTYFSDVLHVLSRERTPPTNTLSWRLKSKVVHSRLFGRFVSALCGAGRLWSRSLGATMRFNWNLGISFTDFGYVRQSRSPAELRDLERLLNIWNKFPRGVDANTFRRIESSMKSRGSVVNDL